MLVVDASAVVELLVNTTRAADIRSAIGTHGLHAPHLLPIEATSALRTLTRTGAISVGDATKAVVELDELGIEWYDHAPFLHRCLELRESVSAYDALYLALAEAVEAPLLTCDTRLARAHGHRADVLLV